MSLIWVWMVVKCDMYLLWVEGLWGKGGIQYQEKAIKVPYKSSWRKGDWNTGLPAHSERLIVRQMIAFEVSRNGKRVCIAGAEDLGVLSAHVTAVGKLGNKSVPKRRREGRDLMYSVGGLTSGPDSKKNVHLSWKSVTRLKVGDVIQVRILEVDAADKPRHRTLAKGKPVKAEKVNKPRARSS